jgi:hypothetical protein
MKTENRFHFPLFLAPEDAGGGGDDEGSGLFGAGIIVTRKDLAPNPEVVKVEVKPPEKKPDVKPEDKKPADIKPEDSRPEVKPYVGKPEHQKESPSAKNFREVTAKAQRAEEALEKERKAWEGQKAQWEEERKKVVIPEDFQKQFESLKAEKEKMEKDFGQILATRAAHAELGPKRNAFIAKLSKIATATGDPSLVSAVEQFDYDTLAEFADSGDLTPSQKREWNRSLDDVLRVDDELTERTKDPENAWQNFQATTQANQRAQMDARKNQLLGEADTVFQKLTGSVPALRGAPDLSAKIKKDLIALAGGEGNERFPVAAIMQTLAEHHIYETLASSQAAKIKKLEEELAEKTEAVSSLRSPGFRPSHMDPEDHDDEDEGSGLFGAGIRVVTGR